jgi:hypothetical protein
VNVFLRNNAGDVAGAPYAKKMAPLVPRLDASRDWTPAEVAALFDEIAAITPVPLEMATDRDASRTFKPGSPLPPSLADAPWGEAQTNGLRLAWLLEPRSPEHRLQTPLRSRVLFHNSGKDVVVFRTRTWHQVSHEARDAKGGEIKVDSVEWMTLGRLVAFRLAPGEFVEVTGPGIGLGARGGPEDLQGMRVGSWVEAKAGDDVTLTSGPVLASDRDDPARKEGGSAWWPAFIAERLSREAPLPADPAERTRLLDRAMRDLFGVAPTADEAAAFLADRGPDALDSLAKRLAARPGISPFAGPLSSGPTRFRVLPSHPDSAYLPRTAIGPGRYTLGADAVLVVTRQADGDRIVNEASLQFPPADPTNPAPAGPHALKLPDWYDTWAAAWIRGSNVLWVQGRGEVIRYDFAKPAEVKETTLEQPARLDDVPEPIRKALRSALAGRNPPASSRPAR